jgi:hypothetical protein
VSPWGPCWDEYSYPEVSGIIFVLSKSGGGWGFNEYHAYYEGECKDEQWNVTYHALAMDAAGNLYASAGGAEVGVGQEYYCGVVEKVSGCCSYTPLVSGAADIFYNLTSDANGNVYGTANTCGGLGTTTRTSGMVWQYSP